MKLLTALLITLIINSVAGADGYAAEPPPSPREIVTDTIHGVVIEDPYRWLEDSESEEVQTWTQRQWEYLRKYVDNYPQRQELHDRISELMTIGSVGTPSVRDSLYFFKRREGDQNHAVLYVQRGLDGEPRALLDPNQFSADGTVALDWYYPSQDGSYLAYGKSDSGSERSTLYILQTSDGTQLPDVIRHARAVSLAWLPDNSGFYYTRHPDPDTIAAEDADYYRWIYLHTLGQDPAEDELIFGPDLSRTSWTGVSLSPDGRRLMISSFKGWSDIDFYYRDLDDPAGEFLSLYQDVEASLDVIPLNDRFLIKTNLGAPRYRLLAGTYDQPSQENWRVIIPERESILKSVSVINGQIVAQSLENAYSKAELFTLEGEPSGILEMPSLGTIYTISGEHDGNELFYYFSSYNVPSTIYRYDFATGETSVWEQLDPGTDVSDIIVKQVWYESKDGTPISMFLVHREGIELDGNSRTYLYGYGGFNVGQHPYFSRTMTIWYDLGGIYAVPNLRGGGEYGEDWHDAGRLEKKQNTFDDFIAAAEYLIDQGYTRPGKLCASGGSNGGLLTGAVLVQRPDLFGAVISSVPLLDMIRYHQFLIARLWIPEYGSSEDPEQFKFLYEYSPYHHIEEGAEYPPVLLTAGLSDGRVHPMHARKMTARLQHATASDNPILLRLEPKTGHGQGKPTDMRIESLTDQWCFVFRALGIEFK